MNNAMDLLADFLANTTYDDLTNMLVKNAKNAMIDSHAAILSGYGEEASEILMGWVKEQGGSPQSTVIGYEFKTSVSQAALMHGVMGHAIDYDDVFPALRGHPSLLVYASILSVAEHEQKNGKEMILSFLLGVEVMSKIGIHLNPSHYLKGWHATSTVGVFGAAIAVGKLYGFNKTEFKTLIGLVSSMMSGIRKNFGTMTKPLHVGNASRTGVEAAQLVREGFTASHNVFDSSNGVFELYSDEEPSSDWTKTIGNPWSIIDPGFHTKKYPSCYATHRFIDGIEDILYSHGEIDRNNIVKIQCIGPKGSFAPLINHLPNTGMEAKFSLEYAVSTAFIDREVQFDNFMDENVQRADVRELMEKVSIIEDDSIKEDRSTGNNGHIIINMHLKDQVISTKIVHGKGAAKNPLSELELKEKFMNCALKVDLENARENEYEKLRNLQDVSDIRTLFHL